MIKKIKFYKILLIEIIETMASICLYLDREGRRNHNEYSHYMKEHYFKLVSFREELKREKKEGY